MATLTVRNLDDAVYARLKRDAAANYRSVEAEARARLGEPDRQMAVRKALAAQLEAAATDPGPGYEGSVATIRAVRDFGVIVVDASLATKWFLEEADSRAARAFFRDYAEPLVAPDLLLTETGGALVRAVNDKRIDVSAFTTMHAKLTDVWDSGAVSSVRVTTRLAVKAATIATEFRHPLADCIYLALAVDLDCALATCDMKFRDKAAAIDRVRSLADLGFVSSSH